MDSRARAVAHSAARLARSALLARSRVASGVECPGLADPPFAWLSAAACLQPARAEVPVCPVRRSGQSTDAIRRARRRGPQGVRMPRCRAFAIDELLSLKNENWDPRRRPHGR